MLTDVTLIQMAWEVREKAYAPYSKFLVGAVLLGENEEVFSGCNVENGSYGLCICAERSALVAAVAAGVRKFRRLVVCGDTPEPISPCGACRQMLSEFAPTLPVLLVGRGNVLMETSMDVLLPFAFVKD